MRLIDADAVKETILKNMAGIIKSLDNPYLVVMTVGDIIGMIDEAPTIEPSKVDFRTDKSANIDTKVNNLISREEAIEIIASHDETNGTEKVFTGREITDLLATLPSTNRQTEYNLETIADIVRQLRHLDDYVADICDRPQVNSAEWVAEKEKEFEELNRPQGEWIVEDHEVVCSVCGQNNLETDFCPNCGADMRPEI